MPLNILDQFWITNDLKQVFISYKVEPGEIWPLFFEVLTQSFLNQLQWLGKSRKHFLKVWDLHDFHDDWFLADLLHQPGEVIIDAFESIELIW